MIPLRLSDIDDVWPRIASVVYEMLGADEIERMLDCCRRGTAAAFSGEDGVVIVTLTMPDTELELLVWAAVGRGRALVERHMPFMVWVARTLGAHRITFMPRRRGWHRRLRAMGCGWRMRGDGMYCLEVD